MMGKIPFFLGLQISQSPSGIFINQSKYAPESLKKYGFKSCDPVDTPMVEKSKLDEDKEKKAVDPSHYLDTPMVEKSKLDEDKEKKAVDPSHYRVDTPMVEKSKLDEDKEKKAVDPSHYRDADHAGFQDTHHSTSGSLQFLGDRLISWSSKRQKSAAISKFLISKLGMRSFTPETLKQLTDEVDE
nr:hypothetical protein [Tanacetum cinerariifolium]